MAKQQLVRLRTGEDVIAIVVSNQDGTTTLKDALSIQAIQTGNPSDPLRVGLYPMFAFAKNPLDVTVPTESISWQYDPRDDMAAEHTRLSEESKRAQIQAETGLILPPVRS